MTEILDILREEHHNIEKLLLVLERELRVFNRAERPDYHVVQSVIEYFQDYPDCCHHPKEDMIFEKLKARDPAAAASVGDLEAEHGKGSKRLRRVARAVESILADQEILRQTVDEIIRASLTMSASTWRWKNTFSFQPWLRSYNLRTGPESTPD